MKTITVTISPTGVPTIEANGFTDGSCKAATKPIIDALSDPSKPGTIETVDKPEASIPAAPSFGENKMFTGM